MTSSSRAGLVVAATTTLLLILGAGALGISPGVSLGDLLGLTVLFAGGYALAAWFCSRGPSLPAAGEGAH